jgi:hypothetical protein
MIIKVGNSTPVSVTLTFETREELNSWGVLLECDESIQELLDLSVEQKTILARQMSMLRWALEGV